jgi:DNA-directed RNA polymerase specialized sigma subunit
VQLPLATAAPPAPIKPLRADDAYKAWWIDKSPSNLNNVVRALDNTVSYKMSSMGIADNPQMKHQARLFVADAIKKYDPTSGASLHTWAQSHLQSMHRFKRENQGPLKVPDRAALDAWSIEKANRELTDELGYEPDVKQLADKSNISVKRIAAVRKATRPVAAASQMYDEGSTLSDYMGEALEYVYDESDQLDRKIIEMTTGYGGVTMLQKNQIAIKLGISPSQVTRRSERIGVKLQEMDQDITSTYS